MKLPWPGEKWERGDQKDLSWIYGCTTYELGHLTNHCILSSDFLTCYMGMQAPTSGNCTEHGDNVSPCV